MRIHQDQAKMLGLLEEAREAAVEDRKVARLDLLWTIIAGVAAIIAVILGALQLFSPR